MTQSYDRSLQRLQHSRNNNNLKSCWRKFSFRSRYCCRPVWQRPASRRPRRPARRSAPWRHNHFRWGRKWRQRGRGRGRRGSRAGVRAAWRRTGLRGPEGGRRRRSGSSRRGRWGRRRASPGRCAGTAPSTRRTVPRTDWQTNNQQVVKQFWRKAAPQWMPPKSKIDPSLGGARPSSNIWFLRPIPVHTRNGISIGSAVFAQLMVTSNRRTHTKTTKYR